MKTPQVTIRGKPALDAELAKAERAKQQEPENEMGALLNEMGLSYKRQFLYAKGRKFRADFAVYRISWLRLALIEIVGGVYPFKRTRKDGSEYIGPGAHGTVTGIKADCERMNEAAIAGWYMLRFLPEQIRDGTARAVLERLLE